MLLQLRDQAAAREAYLRAMAMQEALVAANPAEPYFKSDLAMTCNNLAMLDDSPQSLSWCQRSIGLRKELAALEPHNGFFRRNLARSYQVLAGLQVKLGRDEEGLNSFREGCRLLRQVVTDEPRNTVYVTDLAQLLNNFGSALAEHGMLAEARSTFEESIDRYREMLKLNPDESRVKVGLAMVERNLAELRQAIERKNAAK
jgi:tetratricopeptide (TPR) repeat protein